jgi:hypothetical protein
MRCILTRKQTGLRAEPGALAEIRKVVPAHIPRGYVVESFAGLYRRTIESLKGKLTADELSAVVDVSNGLFLSPQMAGEHLAVQLIDSAPDGLSEKWGIDVIELVKKINELAAFERACLELWAQNYWARSEEVKFGDWIRRLSEAVSA